MEKEELIQKLQDIEWEDFEVKEAKSEIPKNSWETVSAFYNTAGGWLIFGVKKEGKNYKVIGVEKPEKIEQDFIGVLRSGQKFNNKVEVKCKKYNFDGKTVLAFYISLSESKPIYYNNPKNTFIRSGSGDQRVTQEELNSMFRDSAFVTKDREITRLNLNALTDEEFLTKIRVLEKGFVTIAGLLVLGTEDSIGKYFPDFRIDYLEIFGTSYSDAENRYEFRMSEYPNLY